MLTDFDIKHEQLMDMLEKIVEDAPSGLVTVDDDNKIVVYNNAAQEIFGYPPTYAIGKPISEILDEEFFKDFTDKKFGPKLPLKSRVLTAKRSGGETFPCEVSISHTNYNGHSFHTVTVKDVTEQQENIRLRHERRKELISALNDVRSISVAE